LFFDLELAKTSESQVKKWLSDESLLVYHYAISRSIETGRYNLSESEEKIINLKDLTGVSAFKKLYNEITSSFEFDFELEGVTRRMNGSQLRALRQHPDKDVRRRAMQLFYSRYDKESTTVTHIYNQILKDLNTEVKLRGYSSAISVKNIFNNLSDDVIQTLHEVTTESYSLVNRYYKLKAKMLGLSDMTLADIYAPLPKANQVYDWESTKNLVVSAFQRFDEDFYLKAKQMFDGNRIDAPVLAKKRGGAFCSSSVPGVLPYVMLNFMGQQRDVSTLAHELGHAIHAMYSAEQPLIYYHSILPLAETASVFSEMLLTDMVLEKETDKLARLAILTEKLEDIFATSHRQNMFSRFEMETHSLIGQQLLSTDDLCNLYQGHLKQMFGDSVLCPEEYKWEWSSIPHIFESPFYVYAYNFGNLLVMALYQQYLEEGERFIPKLKQVLKMGSSASPAQIAEVVGADLSDREFWKKSIRFIERLLVQLEELI